MRFTQDLLLELYSKFLLCSSKHDSKMPREYQTLLLLYYLMPNVIFEYLLIEGMIGNYSVLFDRFAKNQLHEFMRDEFTDLLIDAGLPSYFNEDAFIKIMNIKYAVLDSLNMPPKRK